MRRLSVTLALLCCGLAGTGLQAANLSLPGRCAATPAAAIRAVQSGSAVPDGRHGFRVESVRWDSLLRQAWAVVGSCDHPGWPPVAVAADLPASQPAAPSLSLVSEVVPVVRAGDVVHVWRNDGGAHIELMATAEQSGAVGDTVRLRLLRPLDPEGTSSEPLVYLAGVVRGPADVELQP